MGQRLIARSIRLVYNPIGPKIRNPTEGPVSELTTDRRTNMDKLFGETVAGLTINKIISAGYPVVFGKGDRRSKTHLLHMVTTLATDDQWHIYAAALRKSEYKRGWPQPKHRKLTDTRVDQTVLTEPAGPTTSTWSFLKHSRNTLWRRALRGS